jgi:hypothetical protein
MRRCGQGAAALAAVWLILCLPAAAADYTKSTYRVPVSQPDEKGAPVSLSTDVYLPRAAPPRSGYPFVQVYHGGGSSKDNEFDSSRATGTRRSSTASAGTATRTARRPSPGRRRSATSSTSPPGRSAGSRSTATGSHFTATRRAVCT